MESKLIKDQFELGSQIRARRIEQGLTQGELADVSRVTLRFVSELERGKETAQYAGIQRVLASLGLDLYLKPR
ncbi:MAG TPA: helix-turn-helix domain-containing protein [Solirubrobacterales bacterium]|jgi:HTH-type transcriptional regulator / antitoxin HipB|nr:helix-turn-helix domain-containing protein [Solirubrobacterales bacterium]